MTAVTDLLMIRTTNTNCYITVVQVHGQYFAPYVMNTYNVNCTTYHIHATQMCHMPVLQLQVGATL